MASVRVLELFTDYFSSEARFQCFNNDSVRPRVCPSVCLSIPLFQDRVFNALQSGDHGGLLFDEEESMLLESEGVCGDRQVIVVIIVLS